MNCYAAAILKPGDVNSELVHPGIFQHYVGYL